MSTLINWSKPLYNLADKRVYFSSHDIHEDCYIVDGWKYNEYGMAIKFEKMSGLVHQKDIPPEYDKITNENPFRKKLIRKPIDQVVQDKIENFGIL